ncbi:MAG: choice-of-anchor Q domain-containing protein [Thermoguttaceae bacterium]
MSWLDRILGKTKGNRGSETRTQEGILTKRRKNGLNFRSLSLEPLESRELLAVSAEDFDLIKTLYPDLDLRNYENYVYTDVGGGEKEDPNDPTKPFDPEFSLASLQTAVNAGRGLEHIITVRVDEKQYLIETIEEEVDPDDGSVIYKPSPLVVQRSNVVVVALPKSDKVGTLMLSGAGISQIAIIQSSASNVKFGGISFVLGAGIQGGAVNNAGSVFMTECYFSNNGESSTTSGGAVYNTGRFEATQTPFYSNHANTSGGAFYNAGTAFLTGCELTRNGWYRDYVNAVDVGVTTNGGAIYNAGTMTLNTGTDVSNNRATASGGGIYNAGTGTLYTNSGVLIGGTVWTTYTYEYDFDLRDWIRVEKVTERLAGNRAVNGGGIYNAGGTMSIFYTDIVYNYATTSGGGVWTSGNGGTISGSRITNNGYLLNSLGAITASGGGIYVNGGGTLSLAGSSGTGYSTTVSNNKAGTGGGIRVQSGATLNATGTVSVSRNTATTDGGGIYVQTTGGGTTRLNFSGSRNAVTGLSSIVISNNTAGSEVRTGNGGGIYVSTVAGGGSANTQFNFNNVEVSGNTATNGGGLYSLTNPAFLQAANLALNVSGFHLARNTALVDGGGFYNELGAGFLSSGSWSLTGTRDSVTGISSIVVEENIAGRSGGGLCSSTGTQFLSGVTISVTGVDFRNNQALGVARIDFNDVGNSSIAGGGGIYQPGGTLTVSNVVLEGNQALRGLGGGILTMPAGGFLADTGTVNVTNGTMIGGSIALLGGGISSGSTLNINSNSEIVRNQAVMLGGGILSLGTTNINTTGTNSTVRIAENVARSFAILGGRQTYRTDDRDLLIGLLATLEEDSSMVSLLQNVGMGAGIFQYGGTLTVGNNAGQNRWTEIDGNHADFGGGIVSTTAFTVQAGVVVSNNRAVYGGGLYCFNNFTVNGVNFIGNVASLPLYPGFAKGGGIYYDSGTNTVSVTISNVTFKGNYSTGEGGSFYIAGKNTSLTLNNCEIWGSASDYGTSASLGGGVYYAGGQLRLTNSRFYNLNASLSGGAVYVAGDDSASTVVTNCRFDGNAADQYGGGAIYQTAGTLTISGTNRSSSLMTNNSTKGSYADGGAVLLVNGTLNISSSTISGNTTLGNGGAVYTLGTLTLTDTEMSGNYARKSAGAIFVAGDKSDLSVNNVDLFDNAALELGGAVYIKDSKGKTSIVNSRIENNYAIEGAAIWLDGSALTLQDVYLHFNEAGKGGAIEMVGGELVIINGSFVGNKVVHEGGAVLQRNGRLTLVNTVIADNTADFGAGVYQLGGRLELYNCTIVDNTAILGSGGLHLDGVSQVINNTIIANNRGTIAGDLYHYSGSLSGKNNLIGAGAGQYSFINGVNGNIVGTVDRPIDPMLGELTATPKGGLAYPLREGSPALGKGDYKLVYDGVETDIFGNAYYPGQVDIGVAQMKDMPIRSGVTYRVQNMTEFQGALEAANLNKSVLVNGKTFQPGSFTEQDRIVLDTDYFDVTQVYTLTLSGDEYRLLGSVEIDTNGVNLVIEGAGLSRVLNVKTGVEVTLIGVSITGGLAIEGGGIYNDGHLTLIDCSLYGNSAYSGGAIYNHLGTLEMRGTDLVGNRAKFADNHSGVGDVYQNIMGGALYQLGGTVSILDCRLSGNSSDGLGGAIYQRGGTLEIEGTAIGGNKSVRGGGVYFTGLGSVLNISASSITDNTAQYGGGIWQSGGEVRKDPITDESISQGGLKIVNTTISDNRALLYDAGGFGGGIYLVSGELELLNVTIVHNAVSQEGGGIYMRGGNLVLNNTLITENTKISLNPNMAGRASDIQYYAGKIASTSSHNLIGDGTGQSSLVQGRYGNQVGTFSQPLDARLGARVTFTGNALYPDGFTYYALRTGSSGIDAGNNDFVAAGTDQLGYDHDRIVNGVVDIGAIEYPFVNQTLTDEEFEQLRAQYPGLTLANRKEDYNVLEIAAMDISGESLRAKLEEAGNSTENDLIVLRTSVETQNLIKLGGSELLIDIDFAEFGSVTIVVLGSVPVTINAEQQSRLFHVVGTSELGLGGLVMKNGFSPDFGGAIYQEEGSLLVSNCVIENSVAENGGAIAVQNGQLVVTDDSRLLNNTASSRGGALYVSGRASNWVIESSSVRGNQAGIYGGGVYQQGADTGLIITSTVAENQAQSGAGVYLYSGPLDLVSTTIAQNGLKWAQKQVWNDILGRYVTVSVEVSDTVYGGGIYQENGTLGLYSNTIVNNWANRDGGGVYKQAGTLNVYNTIVSYNYKRTNVNADQMNSNIVGTILGSSNNLIDYSGVPFLGSKTERDEVLKTGQVYYPLLNIANSPAIDRGANNRQYAGNETDQIGNTRIVGAAIDIGAIESIPISEAEYRTIIGQYAGLNLSGDMRDYNIILLKDTDVSETGLRKAIETAEKTTKTDLIIVYNTSNSIQLSAALGALVIDIDASLKGGVNIIAKDVMNPLVIDAQMNSRVFEIGGTTSTSTHVELGGLVVTGGNTLTSLVAEKNGGGISVVDSSLKLSAVTVSANSAEFGGGLWLDGGTVSAYDGTSFVSNLATNGGGIAVQNGTVLFDSEVLVKDNHAVLGGGVYQNGGTVTFKGVFVEKNIADTGAGIWLDRGILNLVEGTQVLQNLAVNEGGGVYQQGGALLVDQSAIASNLAEYGAGLYQSGGSSIFSSSSVYDNSAAENGGGLFLNGGEVDLKVVNSTFSRNTAQLGGAIYLQDASKDGSVKLSNATIAENNAIVEGGGLYQNGGHLALYNTIVAKNMVQQAGATGSDMYYASGDLVGGYNVIGDGSGQPAFVDGIDGNQVGKTGSKTDVLDPGLENRVDLPNGQVYYMPESAGSVVVDAGNLAYVDLVQYPYDQIGNSRVYNNRVDVGAIESLYRSNRSRLGASIASNGSVDLNWSPVKEVKTYDVQRFNTDTLRWESIGTTKETTFVDSSAQSGQIQHYRIVARNLSNESFVASSVVSVTLDTEEMELKAQTQILIREKNSSNTDTFDAALASQQSWVNEWSQFWVEIWAKPEKGEFITEFRNCRFDYDSRLFAVNTIEFGPGYDGTGDVSNRGVVSLSGTSSGAEQGEWVLLARVSFKAAPTGSSAQSAQSALSGIASVSQTNFVPNGISFVSSMEIATRNESGQQVESAAQLKMNELPVYPVIFDFNGDGRIGAADFLQFAKSYGKKDVFGTDSAKYDLNGDGQINAADFLLFARSYGKNRENGLSNSVLPKPKSNTNNGNNGNSSAASLAGSPVLTMSVASSSLASESIVDSSLESVLIVDSPVDKMSIVGSSVEKGRVDDLPIDSSVIAANVAVMNSVAVITSETVLEVIGETAISPIAGDWSCSGIFDLTEQIPVVNGWETSTSGRNLAELDYLGLSGRTFGTKPERVIDVAEQVFADWGNEHLPFLTVESRNEGSFENSLGELLENLI